MLQKYVCKENLSRSNCTVSVDLVQKGARQVHKYDRHEILPKAIFILGSREKQVVVK